MRKINNVAAVVNLIDQDLRQVEKKGYVVSKKESRNTVSVYYTIGNGKNSISFRISDHQKPSSWNDNISTLDVSYNNVSADIVHRFVQNKVDAMHRRILDAVLFPNA